MLLRLIAVLAVLFIAVSCSDQADKPDQDSIEYKLAVVDSGKPLDPNDSLVLRFRSLLSALDPKCQESPSGIADIAVAMRNRLRDQGINRSMVPIMEFVNQNALSGETVRCAELFAFYVAVASD